MKSIKRTSTILLIAIMTIYSCKKDPVANQQGGDTDNTDIPTSTGNTPGTIVKGSDPVNAVTQGFFLDNSWQPKTFTVPATTQSVAKPAGKSIFVSVDLSKIITKTSPYLFGNNTNPFMGQFVTEPVLMSNISTLSPNILRFPGGSLSDIYFWNGNGTQPLAPADAPAQLLDLNGTASAAGYWYGNNPANWTVTLDNYYKVLQQTNSTGLITVNYGYARYGTSAHPDQAAAHLAAQWVRYDKGRTKYWEIGNENYGNWEAGFRINTATNQDGQPAVLTPTLYGTHFKVFADSMRAAAAETGATIQIGIVLTEAPDNATGVPSWNNGVLKAAGNSPDYFVVHNYYTPYQQNSNPNVILGTPVPVTKSTMDWVKTSAQNAGVMQKPVALDEWNIFSTGSNQMVSHIAGVHGVMVLGELLKNQFSLAARWDLANAWDSGNDMGMFNNSANLSNNEPGGSAWNARPAFYYIYYFQKYFGDRMVASTVTGSSDILSYASSFTSGQAGDILVNKSATDHTVTILISNFLLGDKYYFYVLKGGPDATFSRKVVINGNVTSAASGGPPDFTSIKANSASISGGITVTVPAYGVVYLVADKTN
ncbi:MAG TPA: hypothetical protein VK668_13860 [Mucilaginibacter sp.]|nr:hypothetical protein [Mucilaginibacter sp.]